VLSQLGRRKKAVEDLGRKEGPGDPAVGQASCRHTLVARGRAKGESGVSSVVQKRKKGERPGGAGEKGKALPLSVVRSTAK